MCGLRTRSRGITPALVERNIQTFIENGATPSDVQFVNDFFTRYSRAQCCLPKGHDGPCKHKLESLFPEFRNKIADCHITPGNSGLFHNRAARHHPIQLLRSARLDVGRIDTSFAIPLEFGGTGFTTATAYFDWAALLTMQKGYVPSSDVLPYLEKYREHAEFLSHYYYSTYRLSVVNDEGYLCDPFTFQSFELDDWSAGDVIQFAHILPVSDTAYRTRGLNTIPATRETNMLQGDRPWTEFISLLKERIAKH